MLSINHSPFAQPSIKPIFDTIQHTKPDWDIHVDIMGPFNNQGIFRDILIAKNLTRNNRGQTENYMVIKLVHIPISSRAVAEWNSVFNAAVERYMENDPDRPIDTLRLMNTALSESRQFYKMLKIDNSYFVFTNQDDRGRQKDLMRKASLAILHLEATDPDIQAQAYKCLTTGSPFEMPAELKDLMIQREQEEKLNQMLQVSKEVFKSTWFSHHEERHKLDEIKEQIRYLTDQLLAADKSLGQYQLAYYRKKVGLDKTDDADFMEFIEDLIKSDSIVKVLRGPSGRVDLVLKGYVHFADSEDFLNPTAVANSDHPLNQRSRSRITLQGLIDNEIRMPIIAGYNIYTQREYKIIGTDRDIDGFYDTLRNSHIIDYDCFEGYKTQAIKALQNNDYFDVIEQLLEATGNINLFDSTVVGNILYQIEQTNLKIEQRTRDGWKSTDLQSYVRLKMEQEEN